MSDLPERIWAETISHSLLHAWVEGNWHSDEGAFGGVQYIRADLSPSPEVVKELVEALRECTEWMEELRASGDAGFWDWEDDEYIRAVAVLAKLEGLS